MYLQLLGLMAATIFLRALYYFYYYRRGKHYSDIYTTYLNNQDKKSSRRLAEVDTQINQLFRITGLNNVKIPYVDAIGYGQLASGQVSPSENLSNLREDIVGVNLRLFERAIGACRTKAIQSFNPIFWIESFIYLPANVLSYLGAKKKSSLVKIAQLLWWLFCAFATIVGVLFNKEFTNWLSNLLQ